MTATFDSDFWRMLDALIAEGKIMIDRPKGSRHPRYPHVVYPLDYGYLAGTSSMDGGGIDLWLGSESAKGLDAIIVTVDMLKRDSEIKLLIGLTEDEKQKAIAFHNNQYMKGLFIRREE